MRRNVSRRGLTWEVTEDGDIRAWHPAERNAVTWWVLRRSGSLDHYEGDGSIKPSRVVVAKAKRKMQQSNPSRRKNPTKAQKREKSRKASVQRRVAVALAKFLKQANPAMKTTGATVTRLKGGGFTIRPIKATKRGKR